jgi:hypothetical protein
MQLLFFVSLSGQFASLSAQDGGSSNTDTSAISQGGNSDSISETPKDDGIVNNDKNSTTAPDLTKKEKTESGNDAQKKSQPKNQTETKAVQKTEVAKTEVVKTEEIKEDKPEGLKFDGDLLLITEGNFKYRRIPDIKLVDKSPETVVSSIESQTPVEADQKKESSYIDIWKILIIFIIVGIFILYMSRASGSTKMSSKSSRSRKVLNSYRK